ncbi:prenyltransferase/squalene oxidase repeat-containing protein [Pyrococcus abyssi]|uniref:Squalene-hopene cyclase, putative n=1 Tax=Pyrococcus abyssi (strain GE5 / Orsay) TaxID=272844 RepID=Q9V0H4_PYRAB|nr:prenyltransferase/squalene oxidase repeat-containing protein [Pyrococcus abyssi]CAB49729.1 Squalene-hopene cyclase, putative [Pyrococcus abyssi GE5]CCE70216.1 TPA: hypothetical protein PAB1819 [Pyrococcus abyssi GE5]
MRKVLGFIIVLVLILTPVSAVSMLDYSVSIVKNYKDVTRTRDLSLIVMALSLAFNRTDELSEYEIWHFTEKLISWQNDDGGWGYFYGSTSSVPDTGFALIALSKARKVAWSDPKREEMIRSAIVKGVIYLERSFNGNGWGYLKGMENDYRSTLLASAALVMAGYDYDYVKASYEIIKDKMPDDPFFLYLWIVVTKNVTGIVPKNAIEKLESIKGSEDKIAAASYALLDIEGLTFQTALLLSESEKFQKNWSKWEYPIYSTMAFSLISEKVIEAGEDKLLKLCSILPELQNEDGGWSLYKGYPSDVVVTYYVLKALEICNPRSEAAIKALEFMREISKRYENEIMRDHYLRNNYLYSILALAEYNALTEEEKEKAIEIIESSFWGNNLGKQPKTVALAIRTLVALGISPNDKIIKENLEWLMKKMEHGGWGFVFETSLVEWYFAPTYPETLDVFTSLLPVVGKEKLGKTIEFIKNNPPSVEWRKLYAYVTLLKIGEVPDWTVEVPEDYSNPLIDAILVEYYTISPEIPKVNVYTVLSELRGKEVELRTNDPKLGQIVAESIEGTVNASVKVRISELLAVPDVGDYIFVAPVGRIDMSRYNQDVKIYLKLGKFTVNGISLDGRGNLVIVPGRNREGALLFVLYYGKNVEEIAKLALQPSLLKYFHGKAVIIKWNDVNKDGEVEVDELTVKFL